MSWRVSAFFILLFCCATSKSLAAETADMHSLTTSQKEKISGLTYEKDYLAYPWNVKMSFAYPGLFVNIEVNYTLWKVLEIGAFTGVYRQYKPLKNTDTSYFNEDGVLVYVKGGNDNPPKWGIFAGAIINLHILPFFVHKEISWDFYLINKFYSGYAFFSSKFFPEKHNLPFCMEWGLGLAYFINTRMGIYIECNARYLGDYELFQNKNHIGDAVFRLGFRFGFNKK